MRHARDEDLDRLEGLLADLRRLPAIVERKRGVFYRRGKAFLHFHEDPKGLFADIRDASGADFDRIEVTDATGRRALMDVARLRLAQS